MNLLKDPLIPGLLHGAPCALTLPEVFEHWSAGNDLELTGLRAHQVPAVETAFAQFAAHALEVANETHSTRSAEQWAALLQNLAEHEGAPLFWELVVPDERQAAFMQPAIAAPAVLKTDVTSVNELETLVLSKNHDVKQDSLSAPTPWHWVGVLLTLQTTGGYEGASLYGTMRMNGGYGTRTFVALYANDTQGGRWACDVERLLTHWGHVHEEASIGSATGHRLLAAQAWDGVAQLSLSDLHIGAVEVCRLIRLQDVRGVLQAKRAGTKATRVGDAEDLRGNCRDPWTALALDTTGLKALSPGDAGFTWQHFLGVVFAPYQQKSPFSVNAEAGKAQTLRLRALSRGQGQTNGYQNFSFTFPAKVARRLFGPATEISEQQRLAIRYETANEYLRAQLKKAEWAYCVSQCPLEASSEDIKSVGKSDHHKKTLSQLLDALGEQSRQALLPWLCETHESDDDVAYEAWEWGCRHRAREELTRVLMPHRGANRAPVLAVVKALSLLDRPLSLAKAGAAKGAIQAPKAAPKKTKSS